MGVVSGVVGGVLLARCCWFSVVSWKNMWCVYIVDGMISILLVEYFCDS